MVAWHVRRSTRPPRRSTSRRASSATPPWRRRGAFGAPTTTSIPGSATRPWPCSSSACASRRRRGGLRHGHRHGRRFHRADGEGQAGDRSSRPRAVRLLPLHRRGTPAPLGIGPTLVDGTDLDQWRAALRPGTRRCSWRPTNPRLEWSTSRRWRSSPMRPARRWWSTMSSRRRLLPAALDLGADVVVYSATKHIDGQGRALGGVILGSREFIYARPSSPHAAHRPGDVARSRLGACSRAWRRWRCGCAQQTETALNIADALRGDPRVRPGDLSRAGRPSAGAVAAQMSGGGTVCQLEMKGGKGAAFRSSTRCGSSTISNNLGDAKSIVTHPATTTHQRLRRRKRARLWASATGFCACRSASRTPTISSTISTRRWRASSETWCQGGIWVARDT